MCDGESAFWVCFEMYRKLYKENTYNLRLLNLNFTKWSYDKQVKIDTKKYRAEEKIV